MYMELLIKQCGKIKEIKGNVAKNGW